jgi:hypothetical protein
MHVYTMEITMACERSFSFVAMFKQLPKDECISYKIETGLGPPLFFVCLFISYKREKREKISSLAHIQKGELSLRYIFLENYFQH